METVPHQQENHETASEQVEEEEKAAAAAKWPGWPGDNVYRLIVPVSKVGSIIGRKGELVRKMCDETRARVRILDAPPNTTDRVVLISGKEEPEVPLSPAMDAAVRIFKRISSLSPGEADSTTLASAGAAYCSIRLLVASSQAISLIGKQGSTIKSIQESSGAAVRVLAEDESPSYATSEERVVEIHGEATKVLKALEAVVGQLRKFLVDHSVIPIFEKTFNATISQEHSAETWVDKAQPPVSLPSVSAPLTSFLSDYSMSLKRDPSIYDREALLDPKSSPPGLSLYGGLRSTGLSSRTTVPIVTQVTQTMQVPMSYAEDIIGVGGRNIAYIRETSGATLTVRESMGLSDEITVEIRGSSTQVQTAQQLIQGFINSHKEPASSLYGKMDTRYSAYSQLSDPAYPSSSLTSNLGEYRSSSLGGGYGSPNIGGGYNSYKY